MQKVLAKIITSTHNSKKVSIYNMSLASALLNIWHDGAAAFSSSGYSFFTLEANLVCMVIIAVLFSRQQNSSDQTEAGIVLVRLMFIQIVYCLSWILRVLSDVSVLPGTLASQYVFTAINLAVFSVMCWQVFVYSELYQKSQTLETFGTKFLLAIPCIFNILMLIASPFTGLYFSITGEKITRGVLYPVMIALCIGYVIVAFMLTLIRRSRMTRYERDSFPLMAVYPAIFAFFGILQTLNWKMPLMCYAIVIADILVYLSYVDGLVSVDPLTKIANKNGLARHLAERLGQPEPENLHVFAVDVEDMSTINSAHGRLEGDRALILVAGALKKLREEEHDCFISRYYGDEFMVTAEIQDKEELDLFIEHIRNYVNNAGISERLPYHLRVSIGWSKYEAFSRTETISGLIGEADRALAEGIEQRSFQTIWRDREV